MNDLQARLADLPPRKRELLLRQLAKRQNEVGPERIPRLPRQSGEGANRFPLSFSQIREWILVQLEPGTASYNIPGGARIEGPLDVAAFRGAVTEIVRRHEALRTTFVATADEPLQEVAPPGPVPVPLVDLAGLPEAAREAEAARLTAWERGLVFDLVRGPLLRVALLRLGPEEHAGLFTMHHIISDGWSVGLFNRELATLYRAAAEGQPSPLPELPVQYADFAVWQRERLQGEALEEQIDYWRRQLEGAPPLLPLPTDRPRPPMQTVRGGRRSVLIPPEFVRPLKVLGQEERASLFMVVLAGLQSVLARWSGVDDVPVGTYTGNRSRAELEGLIGFFINTLVLRTRLEDGPGFRALVGRVREVALGAFSHGELPFEKLLEELDLERDLSHSPLFQVLCVLQSFPSQSAEVSGVRLAPLPAPGSGHVDFDLSVFLEEFGDTVGGAIDFNTDLFDGATVERLIRHLLALLSSAVAEPERPVHELPLLSAEERDQLLREWSGVRHPPGRAEAPVQELISAWAEREPGRLAAELGDGRLTYGELEARANRLARHLRRLGIGPEGRVALAAERSLDALVGMLAVLKAGGAYVPIDPAYPKERRAWMLEDSQAGVLLTGTAAEGAVPLAGGSWEKEGAEPLGVAVAPESAAYLIYTSGSTGRPKGVVVEHRSLAAYTLDAATAYGVNPEDRVLQFASLSFDTSAEEIWPALASGATLVLRPEGMLDTVPRFLAELDRLGITLLNLPTAYWHELTAGMGEEAKLPPRVGRVVIGGERALPEALADWRERTAGHPVRLINTYGPTETTIVATRHELDTDAGIGRPIAGARVYVADRRLQPVPHGVAGELLIGGVGLSRGYLGRPELTAAAFVPDPWSGEPGSRLYRTGDRVRFRLGGILEFLGRVDGQVKLRGFRIEPGEIESVLTGHPGIAAAAIGLHEETLVAWVVPAGEAPTVTELRRFLAERLPEHMIPAVFLTLEALPLTASGKVDRRALPKPEGERPRLEREYVPPEGEIEEALAALWSEVLGIDRVGVRDNFFELGGHSLLATQVVARIRERLQVDLPLLTLFQMPTVEQLALVVEEAILDRLEALEDEEVRAML